MFTGNQIVFQIVTGCSLNCALCISASPLYKSEKKQYVAPFEQVRYEIDQAFIIYDYIERITIAGGEPLLHPNLTDILRHMLRYQDQFECCRIFTNGTIMPKQDLLALIAGSNGKAQLVINDYGAELSNRATDIVDMAACCGIQCRVIPYHGQNQYYNGWTDFGSLTENRRYTPEAVQSLFTHCHFTEWPMFNFFKKKLFYCTRALAGHDLGYFNLKPDEYLDLTDTTKTLEEKRAFIRDFKNKPHTACQYCNSFDTAHSPRFPAAVQIEQERA